MSIAAPQQVHSHCARGVGAGGLSGSLNTDSYGIPAGVIYGFPP